MSLTLNTLQHFNNYPVPPVHILGGFLVADLAYWECK